MRTNTTTTAAKAFLRWRIPNRSKPLGYLTAFAAMWLSLAAIVFVAAGYPRWFVMWLLAGVIFAMCKLVSWVGAGNAAQTPRWRHAAYLFAWPGLDADRFLDPGSRPTRPGTRDWLAGASKLVLGVFVFWTAHCWISTQLPLALGWAGMAGVVLMLHFGSFHLLSCTWRAIGIDARPLMVRPLLATSVSDFWSHRWNTAFRDFAHQFLFVPIANRFGRKAAVWLSFLASGLIHDIVISVPAGAGYGMPTLFFLIQSAAMFAQRSRIGRAAGLGRGWRGRLFTAAALLLPAPMLFHQPFIVNVVIPFMSAFRAA